MMGAVSGDLKLSPHPAGLCAHCRYVRLVRSARGSVFLLCDRSRGEPEHYAKYPRLPVTSCSGYELDAEAGNDGSAPGAE
jgi:hypothetical protein